MAQGHRLSARPAVPPGAELPPPVRRSAVPFALPAALGAVVLIAVLGDPFWLVTAGCVVVALGIAAAVADETRRRRSVRAWDRVAPTAVADHVDLARLSVIRTQRGELEAIRALRSEVPGIPLRRARDLVETLTGVGHGAPPR